MHFYQITEFRFLRINYESLVDWCMHQDLLRCSPNFYGSPRYDCVMVNTAKHTIFRSPRIHVQLRDNDMGLWCVRAKPRSSSEIISVRSIVRGAALTRNPETDGDYFVIHTVDTDMFLRVKALQASAQSL
ncbi:hypothetical protein EV424DRAFT_1329630 [Suillus variegatus]|nr:hypothetical protein EV424DRAFT_1329630 [Suillus variegatus]